MPAYFVLLRGKLTTMQENLSKKIKKNLYGKPQIIHATFPAGMGETALLEVQSILKSLWFKQKYTSVCSLVKNIIRIETIHLFAVTELLMRSQSLSDIRLIVFEGSASGREAFKKKCLGIHWDFYLDKKSTLKIKVNSVASRAFHETGLKEILSSILTEYVSEMVSGENTNETTCLYVELYKDRLTISLSLAGEPLYKRGFRQVLSASAPLREDAAFCCLNRALQFAEKHQANFLPDTVFIPFSGTGTFTFEFLQTYINFSPVLFSKKYALNSLPFFNSENFKFLVKKAAENLLPTCEKIRFVCIDNSKKAILAFSENLQNMKTYFAHYNFSLSDEVVHSLEEDFFELDLEKVMTSQKTGVVGNLFIPLNPPYGIRFGKTKNTADLYKKIANRMNEISRITKKAGNKIVGFILCPDERSWSVFSQTLKNAQTETYHFTQGGLDIRVCQFFI